MLLPRRTLGAHRPPGNAAADCTVGSASPPPQFLVSDGTQGVCVLWRCLMAAPSSRGPRRSSGCWRFQRVTSAVPAPRRRLRVRGWLVSLTVLVGPGGMLTPLSALAAPPQLPQRPAPGLTPMTLNQALEKQANAWGPATPPSAALPATGSGSAAPPSGALIPRQVDTPQPSASGSVTLSATQTTTLTTSDGLLRITIPAGAVTSSDLATVGGPLTLQVTQLAGPVGGGPSGQVSLGSYRLVLAGPHGPVSNLAFHRAVTLALTYPAAWAGAFLAYGVRLHLESDTATRTQGVVTTGTVSTGPSPAQEDDPVTLQASRRTLSAQTTLAPLPLAGALVATFNTSAPQATWPTVQGFQTNLNSGSLSYSYPIDLPPGPAGFQPNLDLAYSSASVNEDHNVQTDAPWTGEGWSLDQGEITWSQEDENSGCQQHDGSYQVPCSSHNWQNVWNLSAAGIGGPLLPQNVNWATGPNAASDPLTSVPEIWYTAPESHARIIEINCTTQDLQGNNWTHPCWRVWLPSGELLEFGATNDSVEYYVDGAGNEYIYAWKVDAMVDTHGNQIHLRYQQYTAQYPITNQKYVQDAELANVSYDSPTCQNTSTICPTSGSAPNLWQPLVQVVFDQSITPTRLTGGSSACQTWSSTTARCDTATDFSGGLPGPQVTTLGVLDAIEVQVRPTSSSSWAVLRAYALSYEQTAETSGLYDSISGEQENVAGYLDLTKIQEFGTDWTGNTTNTGTSWPAMQFSYSGAGRSTLNCLKPGSFPCTDTSSLQERYIDPVYISPQLSNGDYICIPWVNYNGCYRYAASETFSQRYLTEADNGMGWQETFTWQEGHMNVAGVPSGDSVTNPFSCTTSQENSSPCWEADEQHWSRILLISDDTKTQRTTRGSPTITVDHHVGYTYTMTAVQSQNAWCVTGACTAVWDWGNVNDGDYLDYYNSQYRGFSQVQVVEQEIDTGGGACTTACTLAVTNHDYITTQGWGVWNQNEVTNTSGVGCWNLEGTQYLCPSSPFWASTNMPANAETEVDQYAADGTTLLQKTLKSYTLNCAPPGDPSTPAPSWDSDGLWWTINPGVTNTHLLVQELDQDNPVVVCDPELTQQQTILVDGGSLSTAPTKTVTYSYDTNQSYSGAHDYGNLTVTDTVASDGGSVGGSGNDIVQTTAYTVNDNVTATATSATGTYIVDTPYQQATQSGTVGGTIQALTQDYYDGNTSLTAPPTIGEVTQQSVASSGSGPYTFLVTKYGYDSYGNLVGILNPNGNIGCTVAGVSYSSCATYDTSSYTAHVTQTTNALGQHTDTLAYGSGAAFGDGEWLQSSTDANSQATTYQYDALGRLTGVVKPGETSGDLTTQYVYTIWCPATGPSIPCSAAYSLPDSTQLGSSTVYDALGRTLQSTDPAGATTTTSYLQLTGPDGAVYSGTAVVDDNQNQTETFTDALGRTRYSETFTGTSSPYSLYATVSDAYDFQGNLLSITQPDGTHTTSFTYDLAGRKTSETDPDLGTVTYQLDNDGNVVQQTDARGDTVYSGYDALDRPLWRNTTNSSTGAYVTYSYDGTVPSGVSCSGITPGSNAVGQVTTEQFKSGPSNSFSGSYCYGYDARGELIGQTDTLAGTTYLPTLYTYNDAGVVTKLTYPTQEYEQYNFSPQERLVSITRSARGTTNYLVPSITYNNAAGAAGKPDSYVLTGSGPCAYANGSTVCASLTYDNDFRLTGATYTTPTSSSSITDYSLSVTYDPVGNVTSVSEGLPAAGGVSGGQDNQQFCYDALNRLTWAGNSGTNPCTNQAVTGTTLASQYDYTASYQYDGSNRLTQSTLTGAIASDPQGSYTYDSSHYHAVDAIGSNGYEAQYDASGNMTCRTPTNAAVCTSSSQTGAKLTYDAEGRLILWVSADGSTTVKYGYDGEGQRFEMQVITSSTTTTTTYLSNLEEVTVQGSSTTKIVYFYWNGQRIAEDDNTHWYYLLSDDLSSVTVVVDYTGVVAAQVFAPYGQVCWAGGTVPTSFAFTGQRADATTGLDYYGARYYDPAAGIFISADTTSGSGLNRYGYVAGNPETLTDPTGHYRACSVGCGGEGGGSGGSGGGSGGGNPPPGGGNNICKYDPDGPECQGGGGGGGGGGNGPFGVDEGCDLVCQVNTTFNANTQNGADTRAVLLLLLGTKFGVKVVEELLYLAAYFGLPFANSLIVWNTSCACNFGDHIDLPKFDANNIDTLAAYLTHETVEMYFENADGVPGDTLPMDYVAEWYEGVVENELQGGDAAFSTYLSYHDWFTIGDGDVYKNLKPPFQPEGPDPRTEGKSDNPYFYNPMGLSIGMLNWEGKHPYWTLSDYLFLSPVCGC